MLTLTSEKTGADLNFSSCDKILSLHTAYNGVEIESDVLKRDFLNRDTEKPFLKMAFTFLRDIKGRLLFVVTIGKNGGAKDILIPHDMAKALAFNNLMSQINADQRVRCRDCNPKFKSCIVIEVLKNYRKKLAISANS